MKNCKIVNPDIQICLGWSTSFLAPQLWCLFFGVFSFFLCFQFFFIIAATPIKCFPCFVLVSTCWPPLSFEFHMLCFQLVVRGTCAIRVDNNLFSQPPQHKLVDEAYDRQKKYGISSCWNRYLTYPAGPLMPLWLLKVPMPHRICMNMTRPGRNSIKSCVKLNSKDTLKVPTCA